MENWRECLNLSSAVYPPTLFDSASIMSVAKFLKKIVPAMNPRALYGVKCVLDGGALLQRIPREKDKIWSEICDDHASYVIGKYGRATILYLMDILECLQQRMEHMHGAAKAKQVLW